MITHLECHSQNFQDVITVLYLPVFAISGQTVMKLYIFLRRMMLLSSQNILTQLSTCRAINSRDQGEELRWNSSKRGNRKFSFSFMNTMLLLFDDPSYFCLTIPKMLRNNFKWYSHTWTFLCNIFSIISWNNSEQLRLWQGKYDKSRFRNAITITCFALKLFLYQEESFISKFRKATKRHPNVSVRFHYM